MASADFEGAMQEARAALDMIIKGDAEAYKALYSDSEEITLANPFGGIAYGRSEVIETLDPPRPTSGTGIRPPSRRWSGLSLQVSRTRLRSSASWPKSVAARIWVISLFACRAYIDWKTAAGGSCTGTLIQGSARKPRNR